MSSVTVSRQGTTGWFAAGILTVAIVGLGLVAPGAFACRTFEPFRAARLSPRVNPEPRS